MSPSPSKPADRAEVERRLVAVLRERGECGRNELRQAIWYNMPAADFAAVADDLVGRGVIELGPRVSTVRRRGLVIKVYRLTGEKGRTRRRDLPPLSFEITPPMPGSGLADVEAEVLRALEAGGGTMSRAYLREAMRPRPPLAHFEAAVRTLEARGLIKSSIGEGVHDGYDGVPRRFRATTYSLTAKGRRAKGLS